MKLKVLIFQSVLLFAIFAATMAVVCKDPSPYLRRWVIGVDGKECVALVKEKCPGLKVHTDRWRKGLRVKGNCEKIPKWTAVATFFKRGTLYNGHAAIFESCATDGFWVYDQWNQASVRRRKLVYNFNAASATANGGNYYVINKP